MSNVITLKIGEAYLFGDRTYYLIEVSVGMRGEEIRPILISEEEFNTRYKAHYEQVLDAIKKKRETK